MLRLKHLLLALSLAATSISTTVTAHAATPPAPNPLSVHVLDLQTGQPSAGVRATLEQRHGDQWRALAAGVTNEQGRIPALYPQDLTLSAGDYRIVFETGAHFASQGKKTFFPRIPVEFTVDAPGQHYHIPLLLSPYGYSTYRGN